MIIIFILIGLCVGESPVSGREEMPYRKDGDFIIGALLALRSYDEKTRTCTLIPDLGAVRRAESIAYTVEQINRNPHILANVTLGYEIYDTCYTRSMALNHALSFTKEYRDRDNVIGVVGSSLSSTSEITTILLSLYNITMISHFATSDELSNTDRYPFFMRTIAPDSLQVDTIIDLVTFYDWKYVAFIYSETIYGRQAYDTFRKKIEENHLGLCIPYARGMTVSDGETEYKDTLDQLENLRSRSLLSVVIVFAELENIEGLFRTANTIKEFPRFVWIGSDSFGIPCLNTVEDVEEVALGAFAIIPKAHRSRLFQDHFDEELQNNYSRNPWMAEYIRRSASIKTEAHVCPSFESLLMDAVEWFAHGLDKFLSRQCGKDADISCGKRSLEANRNYFHSILLSVTFNSSNGRHVFFSSSKHPEGSYEIRQLTKEKGRYIYKTVGNWTSRERLNMDKNVTWYLTDERRFSEKGIPWSSCMEPCPPHQRRVVLEDDPCCWTCEDCSDDHVLVINGTCSNISCINRNQGKYGWPDKDKQKCIELKEFAISKQVNSIVIICVSFLGMILTSLVAYLYIKNREKRIIKASSRELGYVILVGVFFNYVAAVVYRTNPNVLNCICRRIMPYMATSLIYISIATVTIRLYRIFQAGRKSTQPPPFIRPRSQVVITLSLSLIPFVWSLIWMIIVPPFVITKDPTKDRQFIEKVCSSSITHMVGQLVWKMIVLLVCCLFAFRARNLPENYNQSRFIAFCVFGALIVDIAFAPALFSFSSDSATLGIYMSLGAIIHSSIVIVLIFLVRIYAVYYVVD